MNNSFEDTVGELISSEQLQAFSVVELFCEECGDLTPHHIDESQVKSTLFESSEHKKLIRPLSLHECVICRENEENWLGDI